ncbi:cytosolic 5'-nucleotidase IIIB isoform X2 [Ptiloglossa arizonensis]|uniref:cytosolic 5'-nucleotidase IIIB isoform X2 n=1 Tax=Ptiloglossa arizonensis TaxID=3350558 RepID=UPI003F9F1B71
MVNKEKFNVKWCKGKIERKMYICRCGFYKFPTLQSKHVHIKDKERLLRIINTILKDGCNSLQIVTDFDLTLTKQHVNGAKVLSSFGIFNKCKQLPQTYTQASTHLYNTYRPIEIDPYLPLEIKIQEMKHWIVETEERLKEIPFDPDELSEVTKIYGTDFRDGTKELFEKLQSAGVPILVFSAGLGDIVELLLRNQGVLFDNVKVISNFLKYEDGKLAGFKNKTLLHVLNKNEHVIEQEYLKVLEGRKNVVLMGDHTGDASMVDGIVDAHAVLKIGFLYDHQASQLERS